MMKHSKQSYLGREFHPEVRNEWVVEKFATCAVPDASGD